MKKFEFTKDYGDHKIGEVIDMDMKIYHKFIHPLLMMGVLKVIENDKAIKEKVKEVVNQPSEEERDIRKLLNEQNMNELRKLGGPFDAKDTCKEELVDEILEKVPDDKIKEFLDKLGNSLEVD